LESALAEQPAVTEAWKEEAELNFEVTDTLVASSEDVRTMEELGTMEADHTDSRRAIGMSSLLSRKRFGKAEATLATALETSILTLLAQKDGRLQARS